MKRLFLFLIFAVLCGGYAMAYDFSAVCESGHPLYYNITSSSSPYQVEVTYRTYPQGSSSSYSYLSGSLTIPSTVTYNGSTYSVTSIGSQAFYNCSELTLVTIPNSVTSIGSYAFKGCSGLTSLTIEEGISNIGDGAFQNCSGLTSVTIPSSITSISNSLFSGCSGLTSLTIPDWITSIGSSAFSGCSGVTGTLTIPNSVTSIGSYAFKGCSGLSELSIGESVVSIGSQAFYNCSGLASVAIPNSVASIGESAFYNCNGLTELSIGESVATIGNLAFNGCNNIATLNYNAINCTSLGEDNGISGNANIISVTFGDNVETIPDGAFSGCSGLTSVTIGNSITSIGEEAFSGCRGLTTVNFNATNCISMGGWWGNPVSAFYGCTSLTTLNIGDNVTNIPSYAFSGCSGLAGTLTIPDSTRYIGNNAFQNCSGLTELSFGESVVTIGNSAFNGCSGLAGIMTVPNSTTYIGDNAFQNCSGLTDLSLGESVATIGNYAFSGCNGLDGILTVPNSTTNIGNNAFQNCSGLTELSIGESVATIGNSTFYGCSGLASVVIPNSVTSIGESAFYNCNGLTELSIGESVASIGNSAFSGCNNITTLNYNAINCTNLGSNNNITGNTNIATLTIGENVETIPNDAFSGCSGLSGTLTIPNSTTSIGESAFYNCSGLTSVVTGESLASIGASAFEGCSAIRTMTLGSNVATIGNRAFAGCTGLFMATVKPELPPMAQAETFENVSTTAVIKVPCGSVPYYNAAQYWNVFTNVQGDMVYALTVGSSDDIMGYATVTQAPTCTNLTGIITATANNGYRFVSWNDGNTANPRTVTLTSDAHYIANFESLYSTVYNSFTAEACGSYTWNNQTYTASGEYQQTFTAVSSADSIVTLILTIYPMPQPEITASGVLDGCNPSPITLSAGDYSAYNWSTGANTATISISEPGYYYVEVIDAHGCTGISEQINIGLSNALTEAPQISVVGMNSENRNVVAWSALDNANVNAYRIYRENNIANVYEPMATVEALQTTWADSTADPTARAYRYKVTAVDECGGESPMSDYHKTMHLTINQGIGNTWNLIWSHYEGFNFGTYRIYRGTNPSNMTMIGEVPSNLNSYTDNTATDNTGFYYQVEVVRNSRSRDAEISSRSNIVDNGIFPEYTITVMSANPNRGTVTGGGTYPEGTVITIEAIANEGFEFASWSDENTDNPRQITVTADATYIATFDEVSSVTEYTITVMSSNPNRGTVTGGGTYPEGTVITIEAIANEGFEFASWSDENTDNPRQITVTADATYIASFDPATGIEENASLEIALFPNPANDILNITSSETISEIEIVNTLGQVVKRIEVNSDNAVCDVEELVNGVYIVRIHGTEMASVICQRKFIKE